MATALHRSRTGFTLIEMLVVIALIALLAAISAGAFMRVRNGQMKTASETTLQKLHSVYENRRGAIQESVKADKKANNQTWQSALIAAGDNPDVAESLLFYAKMKNELPMTFAEAKANTVVTTAFGSFTLPAKAQYANLPAVSPGTQEESAICFYLAATTSARGGAMAGDDGLTGQIGESTTIAGGWKYYRDAYGTPIAFVRTAYTPEVRQAPYVRSGRETDPFDTAGKLPTVMTNALWAQLNSGRPAFAGALAAAYPGAVNHEAVLISAGPNKNWEPDIYAGPNNDNLLSYRLRREGNSGN